MSQDPPPPPPQGTPALSPEERIRSLEERNRQLEARVAELGSLEVALRRSQERLRLFVENAPAAAAMFDREMRFVLASRRWMVDYGLGDRDIIGKSHYEIFPDCPQRWRDIHARCIAGASEQCPEDRYERDDGSVIWTRWEIYPWHESDGEIGGIIMFTEIITERKETEHALRRQEAQLREINERQERLLRTIQDVWTPIIPVHDGILVMPLVGTIDAARSQQIMHTLLSGIEQHHADYVILDITGVPVIDAEVADHLAQAMRAARLLGAECMLVGISAEVAQTIVQLGLDLGAIRSHGSLRDGLQAALAGLRRAPGRRDRTHRHEVR